MKVQELISKLLDIVDTHGDISAVVAGEGHYGWFYNEPQLIVGDLHGETKVVITP
jgi:hypothetical protein